MTDTSQLLRAYVETHSDPAFRELVARYVNLVYSTAMRLTDDNTHLAEDIAQTVFTDLARKAKTLPETVQLGGWLYRNTCFVTANLRRGERRRLAREQQAVAMNTLHDDSDHTWQHLTPVLDEALNRLDSDDRDAIVLRFLEQRDFRSVGAALGVSDDTAQKRVGRALEKLRSLFAQQGVTLTVTLLATILASRSIMAAPPALPNAVAGVALLKASSVLPRTILKMALVGAVVGFIVVQSGLLGGAQKADVSGGTGPVYNASISLTTTSKDNVNVTSPTAVTNEAAASGSSNPTNFLHLEIFAGDSARRLANVPVEIWCDAQKFTWKTNVSDRLGNLDIPLPDNIKLLRITTRLENFADTRLLWEPAHGETIPNHYTLHLARPVEIGGRVEDENGKPIAHARVGFNAETDASSDQRPENHEFGWIQVTSDADGRWEINRLASEMIRRLTGGANHTNYIRASYSEHNLEAEKQLLQRQYVFRLGTGSIVRGTVVDSDGQPVSGATVFVGSLSDGSRRKATSTEDGSFSIRGCIPRRNLVTAEAQGFAVKTIWSELRETDMPLRLQVERAKTMRCRVVNEENQPLAKARVLLYILGWQFSRSGDTSPPPQQIEFSRYTDEDGRLVWTNAPGGPLEFQIQKYGYETQERVVIAADDEEHDVTLQKIKSRLVINGTVRDERGAAVPKFRVFLGYPQFDPFLKTNNPVWSSLERHWLTFANGAFKYEATEPLIGRTKNPGYILKIEADGYANYISRAFAADEGAVRLDVMLRSAPTWDVLVLRPNGQPATDADVGFVSANSGLRVIPGKGIEQASNPRFPTAGVLFHTDAHGQFKWHADDLVRGIMVVHPDGFADVTPDQLNAGQSIQLLRWGRVEGIYLSAGKPVEGREFLVQFSDQDIRSVALDQSKRARTDVEGKFAIELIPPGQQRLGQLVDSGWSGKWTPLEIRSGETTSVRLGENGYTVQARVHYPVEFQRETGKIVFGIIRTPVPPELAERVNQLYATRPDPEVAAYHLASQYFMLFESADGLFSSEDVLAGTFELRIVIKDKNGFPFVASTLVTIPSAPPTGTINLGEIELRPLPQMPAQK